MLEKLKKLIYSNNCAIDKYFERLEMKIDSLLNRCDIIEEKLDNDVKELEDELEFYKGFIGAVAETVPDMMWCKSIDGKYLYANKAIKDGLLFSDDPIGKYDTELSLAAKARFGDENHTFGEICGNSDQVVIDKVNAGTFTKDDGRFLESGKIKGKMVYLEVFKAPMYSKGKLTGVAGTGRDITEYVEAYRDNNCGGCGKMVDIFKKYEYEV